MSFEIANNVYKACKEKEVKKVNELLEVYGLDKCKVINKVLRYSLKNNEFDIVKFILTNVKFKIKKRIIEGIIERGDPDLTQFLENNVVSVKDGKDGVKNIINKLSIRGNQPPFEDASGKLFREFCKNNRDNIIDIINTHKYRFFDDITLDNLKYLIENNVINPFELFIERFAGCTMASSYYRIFHGFIDNGRYDIFEYLVGIYNKENGGN